MNHELRTMNLLIDIGNTNTSLAIVKGKRILKRYFIHTLRKRVGPKALKRLLGKNLTSIKAVFIVDVVPRFRSIVKSSLKEVAPGIPVRLIGRDIKVPIKVKYRKPSEVGRDRLVTSFAAASLYGCPILSVDFGTAVTFDFVNRRGEYEGGLIFPGLRLGLESLVNSTALLPRIELRSMKGLVGRDTRASINKGVLLGYAALCDGIIERFRKKYGKKLKVVATGGDAAFVVKYSRHIDTVKPDLIFTGLSLIMG